MVVTFWRWYTGSIELLSDNVAVAVAVVSFAATEKEILDSHVIRSETALMVSVRQRISFKRVYGVCLNEKEEQQLHLSSFFFQLNLSLQLQLQLQTLLKHIQLYPHSTTEQPHSLTATYQSAIMVRQPSPSPIHQITKAHTNKTKHSPSASHPLQTTQPKPPTPPPPPQSLTQRKALPPPQASTTPSAQTSPPQRPASHQHPPTRSKPAC